MTSKNRIEKMCAKLGFDIKLLEYNPSSQVTPDGYSRGGTWELTVIVEDEEIFLVGDANELLDELKDLV